MYVQSFLSILRKDELYLNSPASHVDIITVYTGDVVFR